MDISLVRRKNLKKTIDELIRNNIFKNSAEICDKNDIEPAYLSQIINGHRNIGEKSARNLEEKLGLGQFNLDRFPSDSLVDVHNDTRKIPVILLEHAKDWKKYVSGEYESLSFTSSDYVGEHPEATFCILLHDPSMEPKFQKGDKIIIDPYIDPEPSDFVIAETGSESVVFKKYRVISYTISKDAVFELMPLNSDFPKLQSDISAIRIIGVAMVHIQKLRE